MSLPKGHNPRVVNEKKRRFFEIKKINSKNQNIFRKVSKKKYQISVKKFNFEFLTSKLKTSTPKMKIF